MLTVFRSQAVLDVQDRRTSAPRPLRKELHSDGLEIGQPTSVVEVHDHWTGAGLEVPDTVAAALAPEVRIDLQVLQRVSADEDKGDEFEVLVRVPWGDGIFQTVMRGAVRTFPWALGIHGTGLRTCSRNAAAQHHITSDDTNYKYPEQNQLV